MRPCQKRKKQRQKAVKLFQKIREDLQLAGLIETRPEGAVRQEQVDKTKQSEQDLTGLERTAVRRGWAVPEETKARVTDSLAKKVVSPRSSAIEVAKCADVLLKADQIQYERDNPELAGKAKGGVHVEQKQQVNWNAFADLPEEVPDKIEQELQELTKSEEPEDGLQRSA